MTSASVSRPMARRHATSTQLAAIVVERLDGFAGPVVTAPPAVINATGVIVHTNLGRAPWPAVVDRGGRGRSRPATSSSSWTATPVGAARAHASPRTTSSR